jgi:hypothetical protein
MQYKSKYDGFSLSTRRNMFFSCGCFKTQHQNPEFGHTQGEILKKPAKKYISIQQGMKLRKPSILVVN